MPYRERRNTAVTLTCQYCSQPFYPFHSREATARCCSRVCAFALGRERIAALRAAGSDPVHGGATAEKRRAALTQRRAAREDVGRHARGAPVSAADHASRPTPPTPPHVTSQPPATAE